MRNGTQVGQAKAFLLPLCCARTQAVAPKERA